MAFMEKRNHLQKRLTVTLAHINVSQLVARTEVDCSINTHWANSAVGQHKQTNRFLFIVIVVLIFILSSMMT